MKSTWSSLRTGLTLLAALCVAGLAVAQVAPEGDPFEIPSQITGRWGDWAPDRELVYRFDDRRGGDTVTGRYVVYSVPIGHMHGMNGGGSNGGSSAWANLRHQAGIADDGTVTILPAATTDDEWRRSGRMPPFFLTRLSAVTTPRDRFLHNLMRRAKTLNGPFPGHQLGQFVEVHEEDFHYVGEHCGFDMFESVVHREWYDKPKPFDLSRPPPSEVPYPFDRARMFGWPDANGVTYRMAAVCYESGSCSVDARPREWLRLIYYFDRAWLCDIPKVVPAHLDLLETWVVEEETEILNPVYK